MNVHREMAKYRLICIRAHEQLLRLREVQQENQQNGTEPSWDSEVESLIYCALKSVESKIHDDFCNAFEFWDNPPNAPDQGAGK